MANQRLADWALDEVADVRGAIDDALDELDEAERDGVVTPEELARVREQLQRAIRETRQAEVAQQLVDIGERWTLSGLAGGPSPFIQRQALEVLQLAHAVGLVLPKATLTQFPPALPDALDAMALGAG